MMEEADPAKKRTLVFLSGGADSLYCLLRQLRETDDQIHVHSHWIENNRPLSGTAHVKNKLTAEKQHRDEIIFPWLRKNERPFSYSESFHDFSQMPREHFFVNRTRFSLYIASMIAQTYGFTRILTGHNFEAGFPLHFPEDCVNIVNAGFLRNPPKDVEWIRPRAHLPKSKVYEYLGDLADMTISCHAPRQAQDGNWEWCEECWQCKDVMAARNGDLPNIRRLLHAA